MQNLLFFISLVLSFACNQQPEAIPQVIVEQEQQPIAEPDNTKTETPLPPPAEQTNQIVTGSTTPTALVEYAKTLIGTPYLYGSTNPALGFDCSGFITNVFNHFKIAVPRSSINFTNVQREVAISEAKPGDIILFTGTNAADRNVGHMGIIVSNEAPYEFIHSTSGKAYGVTISPLSKNYLKRFVKVIRIFKENDL